MAATTSSHEPIGTQSPDTQNPAVVNVRRPHTLRAEIAPAGGQPHADLLAINDAPRPQTALRLPDLAAIVRNLPSKQFKVGSVAQWAGIGLGGLVALWLIFGGGRPPARDVNDAPAWKPPARWESAQPAWNGPGDASVSQPPAGQPSRARSPSAPTFPDPNPSGQPTNQNESAAPELPDWNDPNWNDSANRAAPPAAAPRPETRTARRPDEHANQPPDGSQPGKAQPLGITVPVPQ
ncbi:MAG: hypothetical protein WD063_04275 [Pirellulales bacterium]